MPGMLHTESTVSHPVQSDGLFIPSAFKINLMSNPTGPVIVIRSSCTCQNCMYYVRMKELQDEVDLLSRYVASHFNSPAKRYIFAAQASVNTVVMLSAFILQARPACVRP